MKVVLVFVFFFFQEVVLKKDHLTLLETVAISEISKHYQAFSPRDFEILCLKENQEKINDVAAEILSLGSIRSATRRSVVDLEESVRFQLKASAISTVSSVDQLQLISKKLKYFSNASQVHHRHLVFGQNITIDDLTQSFQNGDGYAIDNVNFLVRNESRLELVTSFMFTEEKCNTTQFRTINRFDEKKMKWENSEIFPEKYGNFHGCPVVMQTDMNPELEKLFSGFSKQLNFKLKFQNLFNNLSGPYDFSVYFEAQQLNSPYLTFHFMELPVVILVPPGFPYSDFEKLTLAFDDETWIAITAMFLTTFTAIWILGRMPIAVRNFVFGKGISTPAVNALDTFLNGGQNKIPGRNFARFILTLFIIWSLIIRTCYQSKLFEVLQADVRKPAVTEIDDLFEQNFTVVVDEDDECRNKNQNRLNQIGLDRFTCDYPKQGLRPRMNLVVEPENKMITYTVMFGHISIIEKSYRDGLPSLQFANFRQTMPAAFEYEPTRLFVLNFNNFTMRTFDSGIINKLFENYYKRSFTLKDVEIDPQVLTMDHLEAGFIVCSAVAFLSFVVFVLEHVVKAFGRKL